jgi:hypothetical protein
MTSCLTPSNLKPDSLIVALSMVKLSAMTKVLQWSSTQAVRRISMIRAFVQYKTQGSKWATEHKKNTWLAFDFWMLLICTVQGMCRGFHPNGSSHFMKECNIILRLWRLCSESEDLLSNYKITISYWPESGEVQVSFWESRNVLHIAAVCFISGI